MLGERIDAPRQGGDGGASGSPVPPGADERLLSVIVANMFGAVVLVRASDATILYGNPTFSAMFGYAPGELEGRNVAILNAPGEQSPDEIACHIISDLRREGFWKGEVENIKKDGTRFWCEANVVSFEDPHYGTVWVTLHLDISARKRAEAELRRSEERFRAMVETAYDWMWEVDADGRFTYTSPRVRDVLGYEPEEVVGRMAFDLLPEDEVARVAALFAEKSAQCAPVSAAENVNRHKDGRLVTVETNAMPILGPEGQFLGYRGVDRDITARKQAEKALRHSQERLRLALEAAMAGAWEWHPKTNEHIWSDELWALFGLALQGHPASHQTWVDLIHPDDRDRAERIVLEAVRTGAEVNVEYRMCRPNGEERWLISRGKPLQDTEGQVERYVGITMDITARRGAEEERRRLEGQMLQVQKLESLGVLAGGMAHDFNNLLVGIVGNIELARMDMPADSPARQDLRTAEAAADQAAALCRQMLAYAGRGKVKVGRLQLEGLIEEVGRMVGAAVSGRVGIRYDFAEGVPDVEGDAAQLRQVMMNLIINASEAMGQGGGVISVSIGVARCDRAHAVWLGPGEPPDGPWPYFEVADSGCGMDEATRARIFEPFFTTKFVGRGLGLAAVQGIVRGHRGAIEVRSEPGRGTTFRVLLPPAQGPAEDIREAESDGGAVDWRGTGTVLLADDEPEVRAVGRRVLEKLGYRVMLAADGAEAIRLFHEAEAGRGERIACVILDLTMPGIDGHNAFLEIRRLRADVPVILTSGYTEQDVADQFAGAGLAGFIHKPYRFKELADKLRAALGG